MPLSAERSIFSTFSQQIFSTFSQHFLNIFSTHFSQQTFLNKHFSTFSQHFLNIFSTKLAVFGSYKWSCRVGKAERGKEEELIIKMDGEGGRKNRLKGRHMIERGGKQRWGRENERYRRKEI